jgi:hypothetical protein
MKCDWCGKDCEMEEHAFFVGTPENPETRWTITAPLYFKAAPDARSMEAGFCGPSCATSFYLASAE